MTSSKPPILLWTNEIEPYREAMAQAGLADSVEVHTLKMNETAPPELLARCEAMLAWRAAPGVLPRAPRLRWIQSLTGGVEGWLALPDLPEGVTLTCARGTHRIQMTENILGALFHLTKPYTAAVLDQRERRWTRKISETLAGKTLGILGVGAIGRVIAEKATALEMRVIGARRAGGSVPGMERVYSAAETDHVVAAADFLLLLLPATAETRGFMNAARLKRMKPSAYLLNFGRGELVVDQDLIDAVKAGTIAGAVLDVFTTEPLPAEHPFWVTPGITVLPHIGGLHPERDRIVAKLFVENLRRFLEGRELLETVDRALGY
jgi:phosphoglycerate dehydrogenase-like enzyme